MICYLWAGIQKASSPHGKVPLFSVGTWEVAELKGLAEFASSRGHRVISWALGKMTFGLSWEDRAGGKVSLRQTWNPLWLGSSSTDSSR
jgi:hypothetical protein